MRKLAGCKYTRKDSAQEGLTVSVKGASCMVSIIMATYVLALFQLEIQSSR